VHRLLFHVVTFVLPSVAVAIALIIGAADAKAGPTPEEYVARVGPHAKLVKPGELVLDGRKMQCGQRPTVLDDKLDDVAAAYPGFIILNPSLLLKVPEPAPGP
jgi:hypothetical protein